ncbi:MAG: FG-GAP repeat protein [Phycisphaerales bacterium]|nr:FG-GAP repeat protein [Phycisphaerales bacterium]
MRTPPTEPFSIQPLEPRQMLAYPSSYTIPDAYGLSEPGGAFPPPAAIPGDDAEAFGSTIAAIGDVDGDGVGDVVIGWPTRGSAHVYSTKTRSLLFTMQADLAGFSRTVAGVGDVSGDGVPDVAVGAGQERDADGNQILSGRIRIYSGVNGVLIHEHLGTGEDELGYTVAATGDVNGDGRPDYAVGAPGFDGDRGRVYIYSGLDGTVFRTITGDNPGDRFGQAISAGVDLPTNKAGDGLDMIGEIVVGSPGSEGAGRDRGRAYIYDGATLNMRLLMNGAADDDGFGASVLAVAESATRSAVLIGSPGHDESGEANAGLVQALGVDGQPIAIRAGTMEEPIGQKIVPLGAITVTGGKTFLTGQTWGLFESIDLVSVGTRDTLASRPVTGLGDVDGDGFDDIAINLAGTRGAEWRSPFILLNDAIRGSSDNGRFLWGGAYGKSSYIVTDGVRQSWSKVPGLERSAIFSVNDRGIIFGADIITTAGAESPGRLFILSGGVKTYIDQAAIVGGTAPVFENMVLVRFNNTGDAVLFEQDFSSSAIPRAWLYRTGGQLEFLWNGYATDINDLGQIPGVRDAGGGTTQVVYRDAAGAVAIIPGLLDVGVIDNDGVVYGVDATGGFLASWTPAAGVRNLAALPGGQARVVDADNTGRVLVVITSSQSLATEHIYQPRDGGFAVGEQFNPAAIATIAEPRLNDAKWVVRSRFIGKPDETAPIEPSSPLDSVETAAGLVAVGVHDNGNLVLWNQAPTAGWFQNQLAYESLQGGTSIITRDVAVYIDPRDGAKRVLAVTDRGTYWFIYDRVDAPAKLPVVLIQPTADEAFAGKVTRFVSPDGRVHLVGLNRDGDFIMLFQNSIAATGSVDNWSVVNLTDLQLDPQGLSTPRFSGELDAWTNSWGGMNIGGIDEFGHIKVIWWAPGLDFWRTDDLTTIAGTPALSGDVKAITTSWGGVTIAGVDSQGRAVSTWWAPGIEWRTDELGADAGLLEGGSLSGWVTPWGGMNFVGIDAATGAIKVVWWAPGLDSWSVNNLGGMEGLTQAEARSIRLTAGIDGQGRASVLYRSPAKSASDVRYVLGHQIALQWAPGDAAWTPEDISWSV